VGKRLNRDLLHVCHACTSDSRVEIKKAVKGQGKKRAILQRDTNPLGGEVVSEVKTTGILYK